MSEREKPTLFVRNVFNLTVRQMQAFIYRFYSIGAAAIIVSFNRNFFLKLFPFAILLSFALLLAYPGKKIMWEVYFSAFFITITGYLVKVARKINLLPLLQILIASATMLLYDVIMEISAPKLGMWYWDNNSIPYRNYLAWFIIALAMHFCFKLFRIYAEFRPAMALLISQTAFFTVLAIYFTFAE